MQSELQAKDYQMVSFSYMDYEPEVVERKVGEFAQIPYLSLADNMIESMVDNYTLKTPIEIQDGEGSEEEIELLMFTVFEVVDELLTVFSGYDLLAAGNKFYLRLFDTFLEMGYWMDAKTIEPFTFLVVLAVMSEYN
ncbi:MAG: hypothetical protein WBB28_01855 [Crinalium sp.]